MVLSDPKNRLTTIPARTICSGENPRVELSTKTKPVARQPPMKAGTKRGTATLAGIRSKPNTIPSSAPAATPSVVGEAIGLRNTNCITQPATANAKPQRSATASLGK